MDNKIIWVDHETYTQSMNPQNGPEWHSLRIGALTAGNAGNWSGRSQFRQSPEQEAKYICGLEEKKFTSDQILNMEIGHLGEPYVFNWYQQEMKMTIPKVGISVWKTDPRFRSSLDVDPGEEYDFFAEIKVPKRKVYWQLIEHLEAVKKGFTTPPSEYMFSSHFDQITTSGVIHNRHFCDYLVLGWETKQIYSERIPIDYDHWDKVLYPAGCQFYETYVEPLIAAHNIKRIDP